MYDKDYDIPYEDRIFSMMKVLMKYHSICLTAEFHKDANSRLVLLLQIHDAKKLPKEVIYSKFGFEHDLASLYFKTEKFILNYLGLDYLSQIKK